MESFWKKVDIILRIEKKFLTVYSLEFLEKGKYYKWMLKSFSIIFALEVDIL